MLHELASMHSLHRMLMLRPKCMTGIVEVRLRQEHIKTTEE